MTLAITLAYDLTAAAVFMLVLFDGIFGSDNQ